MSEGRRVVSGEGILSGAATVERNQDRDKDRDSDRDRDQVRVERNPAEVLEGLVRAHSRLVYRIAYAVLRQHDDAEDATQETFMRVLRYSSKLADVEEPKTWLAKIAWRVAVDRSKRRGREREIPLDDPQRPVKEVAASGLGADESMHGMELSATLERLIATLPEKLREPLILSTIEEMCPKEIATTLGITEAAARSRVFRARQILKEKLAERKIRKQWT